MKKEAPIEAQVTDVCGSGSRRYAVTRICEPLESEREGRNTVTFSLQVWEGNIEPKSEQIVLLSGVERFARGWRAQKAEPISLRPLRQGS